MICGSGGYRVATATLERPQVKYPPARPLVRDLLHLPPGIYDPARENPACIDLKPRQGPRPLFLLPMQLDYLHRKTYRNVVVKARQMGFSTGELADNFWRCLWWGNVNYCIAAHDDGLATSMLRQVRQWIDQLPRALRPVMGEPDNADEITLATTPSGLPINSSIWIVTAKGRNPGRGRHINILHGTEVAFWPDGSDTMAALEASVPSAPHGIITYESTPNGASGHFHELYRSAADARLQEDAHERYTPFFYAWWWEPTYTEEHVPRSWHAGEEEERVAKLALQRDGIRLTLNQLYWRYLQKREYQRKGNLFQQEYAEDDQSCFLASAKAVFPVQLYEHLGDKIRKARDYADDALRTLDIVRELDPFLQVWVEPEVGFQYVIGVDTAPGANLDYSCAVVIRKDTAEHVATYRTSSILDDVFAKKIDMLGRWYNNAFIAVEDNAGRGVLSWLVYVRRDGSKGLGYPNLYYELDLKTGKRHDEPGFHTDGTSKPELLSDFQAALASGRFLTYSANLLGEIKTYVNEKHGTRVKQEAAQGAHDDELMAAMIAYHVRQNAPLPLADRPQPSRASRW